MKKKLVITLLALAGTLLFLTGCDDQAAQQKANNEIARAEAELRQAEEMGAPQWAPETYNQAKNKFEEGRQFAANKNYQQAYDTMQEFYPLIESAKQETQAAKLAAAEAQRLQSESEAQQQARLAEEQRLAAQQAASEKERQAALEAERRRQAELYPANYTVQKGDCLWKIAGKNNIFSNPYQWTKIYQANKDKINNANLIFPGQVFVIPRAQ